MTFKGHNHGAKGKYKGDESIAFGNHGKRLRRYQMNKNVDEFLGASAKEDTASLLRDSIGVPPDFDIARVILDNEMKSNTFAIACAIYLLERRNVLFSVSE